MAPLKPIKNDANKQIKDITGLARKIRDAVHERNLIAANLEEAVDNAIRRSFPLSPSTVLAKSSSEIDALGCELWNGATNILREQDSELDAQSSPNNAPRIVVLLRVFSFLLIHTAHQAASKHAQDQEQHIRTFKIALKACRYCLDKGELDLALKVLECCSEYVRDSEEGSPSLQLAQSGNIDEQSPKLRLLEAEFLLLRVTYAWKSNRLDLAEHFYTKITANQAVSSPDFAEKAADLFYEAGRSLMKRQQDDQAIEWLERAIAALDACGTENESSEAPELRLTVTSSLVECLIRHGHQTSLKRGQNLIEQLRTTHGFGNRMVVQFMRLNILMACQPVSLVDVADILSNLIRFTLLTDKSFKLIMQAIHRVQKLSCNVARNTLGELVATRLVHDFPEDPSAVGVAVDRVEQAVVTYTLFATSDQASPQQQVIIDLQKAFDAVAQLNMVSFSAKATYAAQTLIWKAIGTAGRDLAVQWCSLLRHPLFSNAGPINAAKIRRKLMTIALDRDDLDGAREALFQMTDSARNESITRYLAFKLALRSNDYRLAEESLKEIAKQAGSDQTFLYACVLEAQQSEMRTITVAALQAILDVQPSGDHFHTLLRCVARLLIRELGAGYRSLDEVAEEVVKVFENAVASTQALRKASGEHWRDEVQWWSKNAYNLSLKYWIEMRTEHIIRLLNACVKLIDAYAAGNSVSNPEGLKRRLALCHFLCATAHIVLARSAGKETQDKLQNYLHARQHIAAFQSLPQAATGESGRAFELLKFDLECILHLQRWNELDPCLQKCLESKNVDRWDILADIVLVIRQHPSAKGQSGQGEARMNALLDKIINETWAKDKDITKASRWLRLSFSMDLKDGSGDFAMELLKQSAKMAKKGFNKGDGVYPEVELHWLAVTAFNKAVDLLSSDLVDSAMEWIHGALELARYAADNGALHANLTHRHEQALKRIKGSGV